MLQSLGTCGESRRNEPPREKTQLDQILLSQKPSSVNLLVFPSWKKKRELSETTFPSSHRRILQAQAHWAARKLRLPVCSGLGGTTLPRRQKKGRALALLPPHPRARAER